MGEVFFQPNKTPPSDPGSLRERRATSPASGRGSFVSLPHVGQPVLALHLVEARHGAFELERPHTLGIEGLRPGGGQDDQLGLGFVQGVHQGHQTPRLMVVGRTQDRHVFQEQGVEPFGDGQIIHSAQPKLLQQNYLRLLQ